MNPLTSGWTRRISLLLVLCILGTLLGGCSYFKSSKHVNMAPFAENTINLLADIRQGMDAQQSVYLREYVGSPAVVDYTANWRAFRPMLRGIAAYSIGIVTISKSPLNEEEKCDKLAEVLDKFLRPRIQSGHAGLVMTEPELDEMLANIREQTKFLDGLGAAQSLVDAIEIFSNDYLDFMDDQLIEARNGMDAQIRESHTVSEEFYKLLIESQNVCMKDLQLLREYRQGWDPDAIHKLLELDPQLELIIPDADKVTPQQLLDTQERLIYRMQRIREMVAQVQPDLDLYRNKMIELGDLYRGASNNLVKTRATVIIWSRTHRGLAAGVVDPATFDVMGIAKRALNAALPI